MTVHINCKLRATALNSSKCFRKILPLFNVCYNKTHSMGIEKKGFGNVQGTDEAIVDYMKELDGGFGMPIKRATL